MPLRKGSHIHTLPGIVTLDGRKAQGERTQMVAAVARGRRLAGQSR